MENAYFHAQRHYLDHVFLTNGEDYGLYISLGVALGVSSATPAAEITA